MARRQRSNVRSSSRSVEQELLEHCRALAEDWHHAVPVCEGTCGPFCPFRRARARAQRAIAKKENLSFLKRSAGFGNKIARAYAGALLAASADSLPALGQARLRIGTFPYAHRSSVSPLFQVAVQHWDDPHLRLLGAGEYARKRNLVVYSVGEGMVCSHRGFSPPPAFVEEMTQRVGLPREEPTAEGSTREAAKDGGGLYACPHGEARPAFVLTWRSGHRRFRFCEACVRAESTLGKFLDRFVARRPQRDFAPRAELVPVEGIDDGIVEDESLVEKYSKGEITDRAFLEAAEEARDAKLRNRAGFLLVAGGRVFRTAEGLAEAAQATPAERAALVKALDGVARPVIVPRPSVALVLADVWNERGEAALGAAAQDSAIGARGFKPGAAAKDIPDIIRKVAEEGARARTARSLPRYVALPPAAALADRAARAFRAGAREEAVRIVADAGVAPGPARGVALAILSSLGEHKAHVWRFSNIEAEVAETLSSEVEFLLRGPVDRYDEALRSLATKTGTPLG